MSRTLRQPLQGYCLNPECFDPESTDGRFTFPIENEIVCPKCKNGSFPFVGLLALVHWIRESMVGQILSNRRRYEMACDIKRHYIATETNQEAGTNYPGAVNCPGCLTKMTELGVEIQ